MRQETKCKINKKHRFLGFFDFWKLGHEQQFGNVSFFKKLFVHLFGALGINTKIRSGHIINQLLQLQPNQRIRILDAGCGNAYALFWLAQKFPKWELKGVEIDEVTVNNCQAICRRLKLNNIVFEKMNLLDLHEIEQYDVILSMDVLEHIEKDEQVLHNLWLALKPDGVIIVHLPKRNSLAWRFFSQFKKYSTLDHVRPEYTLEEIHQIFKKCSFIINEIHSTYSRLGEIAFEINYLFWKSTILRTIFAVFTLPIANILGYLEICSVYSEGNAYLLVSARSKERFHE